MNKFRLTLYIETTVFNYFYDERKGHDDVVELFEAIKAGVFKAYTSSYVVDELKRAQEPKRTNMLNLIEDYGIIILDFDDKAEQLAKKYIEAGIIPSSHFYDSVHVAIASVHELVNIISYNFHHINREKTKFLTAAINREEGYNQTAIYTAEEVLKYGRNNGDRSD